MARKTTQDDQISALDADKNYDILWSENPILIRRFLEQRPDYEQLCMEITYILKKRFKDHQIEVSTVLWRAKTLNSFLEKVQRKKYENPFDDIKDFAGVRVVYLYRQDMQKIEEIIHKEFDILEEIDKLDEKGADRFGYLAKHYIAKLGPESSGARYEDLKHLMFEMQIRTVLQDAWAVIDHHLAYKHESDIPKHLQRKLMRIAGMFEMVDDDFDEINQAIKEYVSELNESSKSNIEDFLDHPLDLNSFQAYLSWKFKNLPQEKFTGQAEGIFSGIDKDKYKTLLQLDDVVESTKQQRAEFDRLYKEKLKRSNDYAANQVAVALGIVDNFYRARVTFGSNWRKIIEADILKMI